MAVYNLGTAHGKIEIDTDDLKNVDRNLQSAGRAMLGFGATALAAVGYVIGVGAQFEKEMSYVQAVTSSTKEEMDKLSEAAIELGKKGPFGPREVAAGFVDLAKAGLSAKEIIDGVGEAAVNLAAAGDIPFTQSAEVLVNVLRSFNIPANEAARVVDSIAGAANASTIEISDMAIALKYAAAPAASLGVSVDDVNASLAILGNRGIKGSVAGTALRRVFINLAAPTAGVTAQLKELGIVSETGLNQLFDSAGNLKSIPEVFDILGKSMEGYTAQQKVAALNTIFGARAVNSALILMEEGAEGFADMQAQISETSAADVAAERMDNLAGAIKRFKAAMEAVFITAGSPFQDFLKNIVNGAREVILFFGRMPKGLQTFILASIAVVGILSVMAGIFLLTVGNIVRAIRVFGDLGKSYGILKDLMKPVIASARAMSAAFLTNPVVLIILAIIALAVAFYLLYTRVEGFRKFIDSTWQTIQRIWDDVLEFVKKIPENIGKAWDAVKKKTDEIWDAIYARVSGVIEGIIDFFQKLPGRILGFIGNVASAIANTFSGVMGAIGDFFQQLPGLVGRAFVATLRAVGRFARRLPALIGFAIGFVIGLWIRLHRELIRWTYRIVTGIIRVLLRLPGQIGTILGTILGTAARWGAQLLSFLLNLAISIVTGIINHLIALPGQILSILMTILTTVIDWGIQLVQVIFDTFLAIITTIFNFLVGLPGMVWDFFTQTLANIIGMIPEFLAAAGDIGQGIVDGIIDIITGLPGLVWDILGNVIEVFTDLVGAAWRAAKSFAGGLWNGFKSGLGINSPSFIEEALFSIQGTTADAIRDLKSGIRQMQGLSQGIPTLNSGVLGLSTPAAAALTSNGGGTIYNQNAPLIGQATIRDERDIVILSRMLAAEQAKEARAKGRS